MDNPPDVRQADAGTFEFIVPVEALEYTEEFVHVLHVKSDSVVADEDGDFSGELPRRADLDTRLGPRRRELDRVREQVHEDLPQHGRVPGDVRQRANCPRDRLCLQVKTQIVNHGFDQLVEIYRSAQHFLAAHAGEYEQIVDQL